MAEQKLIITAPTTGAPATVAPITVATTITTTTPVDKKMEKKLAKITDQLEACKLTGIKQVLLKMEDGSTVTIDTSNVLRSAINDKCLLVIVL